MQQNPSVIDLVDPYQQEKKPVERITIASIFPLELVESRKFFPANKFVIPASDEKRGYAPTILTVRNQWEWEKVPLRDASIRKLVPVEEIAADLMNKWTESMPHCTTGCHPGIWVCRDAEGSYADTYREEEVKAARAAQEAYARVWMQIADTLHFESKGRLITEISKELAKWMGVPKPWLNPITTESFKPCTYCTEVIPGTAIICPKCQQVVDVEAWAAREATKQAAIDKLTAAKSVPSIPAPKVVVTPPAPKSA